jgi:hypothetical protein
VRGLVQLDARSWLVQSEAGALSKVRSEGATAHSCQLAVCRQHWKTQRKCSAPRKAAPI